MITKEQVEKFLRIAGVGWLSVCYAKFGNIWKKCKVFEGKTLFPAPIFALLSGASLKPKFENSSAWKVVWRAVCVLHRFFIIWVIPLRVAMLGRCVGEVWEPMKWRRKHTANYPKFTLWKMGCFWGVDFRYFRGSNGCSAVCCNAICGNSGRHIVIKPARVRENLWKNPSSITAKGVGWEIYEELKCLPFFTAFGVSKQTV